VIDVSVACVLVCTAMRMKKLLFATCVIVCVVAATECNEFAKCKKCADETHCKSCEEGYYLDDNSVCRFNCTPKFGKNCPMCTPDNCVCGSGRVWDESARACVAPSRKECISSDPAVCSVCGVGYDLINVDGDCSTCAAAFGDDCLECTESRCTKANDPAVLCGAMAKGECPTTLDSTYFPGCNVLTSDTLSCKECSEGLVLDDGFCKFDRSAIPTSCNATTAVIKKDGSFVCGDCGEMFDFCSPSRCTLTSCTVCKTGFSLTSNGKCKNCSKDYVGCSACNDYGCQKCAISIHVLTPNGCFNQNPYVPPSNVNGGLIAGIVVAAAVLVAVIVIAVYCIVTATAKHGQIDPSLYEEDLEFNSVSVL